MLRSDTWRSESKMKRGFPLIWIWLIVAAVVTTVISNNRSIFPTAPFCNNVSATELQCVLKPGNEMYTLLKFKWNYKKISIIGNKNGVYVKQPDCGNEDRQLHIYNASRVTTDRHENNSCSYQIYIYDCKGVVIEGCADLLRIKSSTVDKVILPRVRQFDLEDSEVGEVSLTIEESKSVIEDSKIKVVADLEVRGDFVFEVNNSTLGQVNNFVYDSPKNAILTNVTINSVATQGLKVSSGVLTLTQSTIKTVESLGLKVMPHARLNIINTKTGNIPLDSIVVNPEGVLSFADVKIGQNPNISFTLTDVSTTVYTLAFLVGTQGSPAGYVTVAVICGLLVGFILGIGATYCYMNKRDRPIVETRQLLPNGQSTPQIELDVLTNNHGSNALPPPAQAPVQTPALPVRPLPDLPKDGGDYEDYTDVLSVGSQMAPQTNVAQRPPAPLPKEGPATTGPSMGNKPTFLTSPPERNKHITVTKKDPRDALPPPPPPVPDEEDTYDILEDTPFPSTPVPPSAASKPKVPLLKKPPPPPARGKPMKP